MMTKEDYDKIGYDIIGCAYEVHKEAGKGMREDYYHAALEWELAQKGYQIEHKKLVPALYKGMIIKNSYQADIVVNNAVTIEVKAISIMTEAECRQLITYMKLMTYKLGYLINFGANDFGFGSTKESLPFKKGLYRFANGL